MIRLTVLYTPPAQVEEFEEHYASVHVPLVQQMPELVRADTARVVATPDGSPPPYHRVADLWFEDAEAMGRAFASDAGKRTAVDARDLAARTGSTVTMLVGAPDQA